MQKKEITKTIYIANDGTEYDSKYECKKHELVQIIREDAGIYECDSEDVVRAVLNNISEFVEMAYIMNEKAV